MCCNHITPTHPRITFQRFLPTTRHPPASCVFRQNALALEASRRSSTYARPEPFHDLKTTKIGRDIKREEEAEEAERLKRNAGKSEAGIMQEIRSGLAEMAEKRNR